MTKSLKAALISGLVFPGAGHIYLKKYLVGVVLLLVAGASVYSLSITVVDTALSVANQIESGNIAMDENAISRSIEQTSQSSSTASNLAYVALMLSWVIGIVDSYRVGRDIEKTKNEMTEK